MKYEYKKVTGYEQKKFIENGHTMLEEDVLQRLKRLAYLEEQQKQANGVNTEKEALHIDSVMQAERPFCIYTKRNSRLCPYHGNCATCSKQMRNGA